MRLIAASHPLSRESSIINVFLDGAPLLSSLHGTPLRMNDKGFAVMEIAHHTGVYELINSDTAIKGTILIKFMNAVENPVIIYELRTA